MPLFDFVCEDCGKHFEELLFEDDEVLPACPACPMNTIAPSGICTNRPTSMHAPALITKTVFL